MKQNICSPLPSANNDSSPSSMKSIESSSRSSGLLVCSEDIHVNLQDDEKLTLRKSSIFDKEN